MAMLSLSSTGLALDHNGPTKGPFDGGGQDQDHLLGFLMEKLKMTSKQVKAWSEERLKIRDAMFEKYETSWKAKALTEKRFKIIDALAVYKNTDNVDPERLQKCLENIKKAITVSSLPAMVERLEALARPVNLKVMSTPEGNIFISSDTFYVEVIMGENGNVKDVMVAHCKDPVSCNEMCESLGQSNFKEFGEHLQGLSEFYQTGGDASQKSKAFNSLQCLEKDLLTILSITKKPGSSPLTVVKNNLGYCTPRAGGRHMRLTYFVSPYDLLDLEREQSKELGPDDPLPKDMGLWVSIGLENSTPKKLQTIPLIVPNTAEGKLTHNTIQLGPTNSVMLPATFVLNLSQEMPLSITLLKQLQTLWGVSIVYSEPPTVQTMNTLICRHTLNPKFATDQEERNMPHPLGYTFHVNLPDQKQRYYVTDSPMVGDTRGILISKIHFFKHSQVIQTINCLRKQANYNALIASCVRENTLDNDESEEVFEVTAYHHHKMTVLFEHPAKDGMACVEFDTSDPGSPKCKLHPREGEEPFCSEEYATKVLQKCLSIPITMRAILKKTEEWLKTRKRKEVPAAATPAMGPSLFPSPQAQPPGPFSAMQKLTKPSFGGSLGTSYNAVGKFKEQRSLSSSSSQKFSGSILGDLTSTMANFFPSVVQPPSNYGGSPPPSGMSPTADPLLLSPTKPSQNPMLTSLLAGTTMGGGPLAQKLPNLSPKEPYHHQHPMLPALPTSPQHKTNKHPMLLTLLQEQNIDQSLATSLQASRATKRRRKRLSEKSPKLPGSEDESGPSSAREAGSSQDVFHFGRSGSKLSSMPLLQQTKSLPLPLPSPVTSSEVFSSFDPNKPNQTLTEFYALLNKPTEPQGTIAKKPPPPARSESVGSISSIGAAITPSPRQSPKTPLSPPPAAVIPPARPPRSMNSTPEMPSPSSNILPGMITEMLPKSDPLPEIPVPLIPQPAPVGSSPKVLTTPNQPTIDPFDFNEDLIQKNVPDFDDMFGGSSKPDAEEFSVNSAIAKLESVPGLDEGEGLGKKMDVGSLLSMATVPPIKPTIPGARSLSLDLPQPIASSGVGFGDGAMDLTKNDDNTAGNSSGVQSATELRSPQVPPTESPLPSPKKNTSSKSHTSKGKPKNFAVEGVGSFQTDASKQKPKRSKKALKEPGGPVEPMPPKKLRKRKKKKYTDSSPECSTGEDYETTVRSEQPLKMTIRVKPVVEPKPKSKGAAPVPKLKVKPPTAPGATVSQSPAQKEESPEFSMKPPAGPQGQPIQTERDREETKKDKTDSKVDESTAARKDSVETAKIDTPPDRVAPRKVPESQKSQGGMGDNRRGDERPQSKLQSRSGMKNASLLKKTTSKGRGDSARRVSHGAKPEVRRQSPEDILNSILPNKSVSSFTIPKLKKIPSQDVAKVGPEGDGGQLTEMLRKVNQSPTHLKGTADLGRLASPKRTPNPALQRPRSASPSTRYDPSKKFIAGNNKGGTFTKPVPGPKGGSISPRGSVSPQGSFGGKARGGSSPMEAGSSPTHKRTPSPQLRIPLASSSSPGLPKSAGMSGSSGGTKPPQGYSPSYAPKTSGGSSPLNVKARPAGTAAAALAKAGSSPNQSSRTSSSQAGKSSTTAATTGSQDKTPSMAVSSKFAGPVPQVKPAQALKPALGPLTQPPRISAKPPPLTLSHSMEQPASAASHDERVDMPASTTPQTPTSAPPTGQRMRSPPPKPRKTANLNAIVSKLTERVQVKKVDDVPPEKGEEQKKMELVGGAKDEVVNALIRSGHVEKVKADPSSLKAPSQSKNQVKEESTKTALAMKVGNQLTNAPTPKQSQTKTAVAQALKSIASRQQEANLRAAAPAAARQNNPSKTLQGNKVTVPSSKSTAAKASTPSEKGSTHMQTNSGSPANKVATQPKGAHTTSKAGGTAATVNRTATTTASKPRITVPPASSKSSQPLPNPGKNKTLQSPTTSNRPIILSKSSSTVTSPDKGATKVTRVQIAPIATPVVAPSGAKGQLPSPRPKLEPKKGPSSGGADPKVAAPKSGNTKGKQSSEKQEKKGGDTPKSGSQPKNPQPKGGNGGKGGGNGDDKQGKDQGNQRKGEVKGPSDKSDVAARKDNPVETAAKRDNKKIDSKQQQPQQQSKPNTEKAPIKPPLKRTMSIDGGIEMPKKILKVSLSHDEVTLAQATPGSGPGPLSPRAVNKVVHKTTAPRSSPTQPPGKSAAQTPPVVSIPKDNDFKVPSPGMLPPSPRTVLYGVRSPGLSSKPLSPTKATSPVSPGIPLSPGEPATGGVPSPQGVKRAATPEEAALPNKRNILLDSCSPVSPADSDDALVIDSPSSPGGHRKPKTLADKIKDKSEGSNRGIHKSPLPQSPLVKSPSIPLMKSPAGISVGSNDAGSPLDDDLMDEALSYVREDSS